MPDGDQGSWLSYQEHVDEQCNAPSDAGRRTALAEAQERLGELAKLYTMGATRRGRDDLGRTLYSRVARLGGPGRA